MFITYQKNYVYVDKKKCFGPIKIVIIVERKSVNNFFVLV